MASRFPISERLARVTHSDDRCRQMFVYIERHRWDNLWEERRSRRRARRSRMLVRQLNGYITELDEVPASATVAHALAALGCL
ncbi:hypothetical protein CTI12_AA173840 [Artemisia annua]|uniref:Uncharacterized protein n=1 Tax=Artemisia annua TaxID=35608 RepID=A0A2U1MS27_ARTAN|nr:hypothetical protein CTI12_AA173840 [Artemisia annua]